MADEELRAQQRALRRDPGDRALRARVQTGRRRAAHGETLAQRLLQALRTLAGGLRHPDQRAQTLARAAFGLARCDQEPGAREAALRAQDAIREANSERERLDAARAEAWVAAAWVELGEAGRGRECFERSRQRLINPAGRSLRELPGNQEVVASIGLEDWLRAVAATEDFFERLALGRQGLEDLFDLRPPRALALSRSAEPLAALGLATEAAQRLLEELGQPPRRPYTVAEVQKALETLAVLAPEALAGAETWALWEDFCARLLARGPGRYPLPPFLAIVGGLIVPERQDAALGALTEALRRQDRHAEASAAELAALALRQQRGELTAADLDEALRRFERDRRQTFDRETAARHLGGIYRLGGESGVWPDSALVARLQGALERSEVAWEKASPALLTQIARTAGGLDDRRRGHALLRAAVKQALETIRGPHEPPDAHLWRGVLEAGLLSATRLGGKAQVRSLLRLMALHYRRRTVNAGPALRAWLGGVQARWAQVAGSAQADSQREAAYRELLELCRAPWRDLERKGLVEGVLEALQDDPPGRIRLETARSLLEATSDSSGDPLWERFVATELAPAIVGMALDES